MTKINPDFIKRLQAGIDPAVKPGETALEAIQRSDAEKVAALAARTTPPQVTPPLPPSRFVTSNTSPSPSPTPQPPTSNATPPVQEVVFIEGHKLPRNFFTCLALCIMKLDNPEITDMFEKFGFEMKDLDGKPVVLKKKTKKKK